MENQQVTKENLAWLAGIWDGEGSFLMDKQRNSKGKYNYSVRISISNSCPFMIVKIINILKNLKIGFHLSDMKTKNPFWMIRIAGSMIKKKNFINFLLPFLVTKQPQAYLMLNFIESRLKHGHIWKYSNEEVENAEQIIALNGKFRNLRDFTPNSIYKYIEKIKSELQGNLAELSRNT